MVTILLLPIWAISVFLWSVFWGRRDTRLGQARPVRCALTISVFYAGLVVTGAIVLLSNDLANGGFGIVSSISDRCDLPSGFWIDRSRIAYFLRDRLGSSTKPNAEHRSARFTAIQ